MKRAALDTRALLMRATPFQEADVVVHLLTEAQGAVSALAKGARRSKRRFVGLEPMHELAVSLLLKADPTKLATLTETAIARPRLTLVTQLGAMEAAGQALRWVRAVLAPHTPEPEVWAGVTGLLDDLDAGQPASSSLAAFGARLLAATGWGLELEACVRCGRACPPSSKAIVDVAAGGIVCRACGGQGAVLSGADRRRLWLAMYGPVEAVPFEGDAAAIVDLIDHAFTVHARGEGT